MWFEVWLQTIPKTLPSITVNLPPSYGNQSYKLSRIIYLGMNHYTYCFLDYHNNIWTYDGQKNDGKPNCIGNINNVEISSFGLEDLAHQT